MNILHLPQIDSLLNQPNSKPLDMRYDPSSLEYLLSTQNTPNITGHHPDPLLAILWLEASLAQEARPTNVINRWQLTPVLTAILQVGWQLHIERHDQKYHCWFDQANNKLPTKTGEPSADLLTAIKSAIAAKST